MGLKTQRSFYTGITKFTYVAAHPSWVSPRLADQEHKYEHFQMFYFQNYKTKVYY